MQIPLKIVFRGRAESPALETEIRNLVGRLGELNDRIVRCDVVVDEPHRHHRQGRQVHVRVALALPDGGIVVSHDPGPDQAHEDAGVAVRDAFRAVRRQLEGIKATRGHNSVG